MRAGEVAVALLETERVPVGLAIGFEVADLLSDVLEAGERAPQLETAVAAERIEHRGAHDGGDDDLLPQVAALLGEHRADVVGQKDAGLVARKQDRLAVLDDRDADAVGVGVGGEQQVGVRLGRKGEPALERLADFRIRVGAGGEVAVRNCLLRLDDQVGYADAREDLGDAFESRAMERGIDDLERPAFGGKRSLLAAIDESVDCIVADPCDKALREPLFEIHADHIVEDVDAFDFGLDVGGRLRRDLAAVGPVDLVAVVLGAVVRCRDADARRALHIAHGEAQGRRRLDARVEPRLHAIRGEHARSDLAELLAHGAAVARDGDARAFEVTVQVIGKALRCLRDRVDVHAVRSRADDAAQTGGAELQVADEGIGQRFLITLECFEILREASGRTGFPAFEICTDILHRSKTFQS